MSDLTPRDRERLTQLETLAGRVRHVYSLVEQFAGTPRDAEGLSVGLRRAFGQLKMQFTTAGFDKLANATGALELATRRGGSHGPKSRSLREGVGNLTRQVDIERRAIIALAQKEAQPE